MRRLLPLVALLASFAADAAPWSSRWTVASRSNALGDAASFTIKSAASLNQVSAQAAVSGQSIAIAASGQTITRTSGSFVTDGYLVGQTVVVSGSSLGNNLTASVTAVAALILTTSSNKLVNETSSSLVVKGQPRLGTATSGVWHTATASQYAGSTPGSDTQMDAQPVAGAAANALGLRTTWSLILAEQSGVSPVAYPYHLQFIASGDANVDLLFSQIDIYFADPALWALVPTTHGVVQWFLDFGTCTGTCLTGL